MVVGAGKLLPQFAGEVCTVHKFRKGSSGQLSSVSLE